MANLFDSPPTLTGDGTEMMGQLYRYLMQMSEQLNEAMNGLTLDNFAPAAQTQIQTAMAGNSTAAAAEIKGTREALRSMIIKTAEIVRSEMEEIRTTLHGEYTGLSEQFGTITQQMQADISANAAGISQNYTYIETIQGKDEGYDQFVRRINERIFSGIIGTDALGAPIYGIAIGENITGTDASGNPIINDNAKQATFTKERLSFWQGTSEVAYFSNRQLYITNAEVLKSMKMGRYAWRVQSDNSLGLCVE